MAPEKAREIARDVLHAVRQGKDPSADRRSQRAREAAQETFPTAVEDYIAREQEGRKGNATAPEVRRTLLREGACWARRPVREITATEIRRRLEEIRDGRRGVRPRPYLANRTFAYLRTFFRWCAEPGIEKVPASPMLGLRRPWEGEEERDRVFDDDELRALWRAADALTGRTARSGGAYLKVMILTGKRRGALAAMRRDEIDDAGLWSPRGDPRRAKRNKRAHPTPLPALALRIIRGLPQAQDTPYVFAGRSRGRHIDPGSGLADAIRKASGVDDFFFHALRHTLETRLAELRVPPHIRDLLLDHAPLRGSGAGYDHHHYADEMREALNTWAAHVEAIVTTEGVRVLR